MRLAELQARHGDAITVEWCSYLLRPEPEERPLDKFTEYTRNWERTGSMEPRTTFNAWSGKNAPPSHSFPSAMAGKLAASFGAEARENYSKRLFEAYFIENRTISDRSVLLDVAAEAGLDRAEFDAAWSAYDTDLTRDVWSDYQSAINAGIRGVPAVVVNRRYLVSGAVDVDEYERVIAQALNPSPPEE